MLLLMVMVMVIYTFLQEMRLECLAWQVLCLQTIGNFKLVVVKFQGTHEHTPETILVWLHDSQNIYT